VGGGVKGFKTGEEYHSKSLIYKYFTRKSLFFKDPGAPTASKSLILLDRGRGGGVRLTKE